MWSKEDVDRWFRFDLAFLFSSTPSSTATMTGKMTTTTMTPILNDTETDGWCVVYANFDRDVPILVVCLLSLVAGFVYCFFGYRFFKASLFLTGFVFGSVLIYVVCDKEALLPKLGNAGVGLLAGILFGLITMLVQYVGLFMTGFLAGLLYGSVVLLIWTFAQTPDSLWVTVGVLFGVGLFSALLALKFQRVCTILFTATIGGALIVPPLDYVVEKFAAVRLFWYTLDVTKPVVWSRLCWYSWLVLAVWPVVFVAACIIQWKLTAVGYNHKDGCRYFRRRPPQGAPSSQTAAVIRRATAATCCHVTNNSKDPSKRFSWSPNTISTKKECQKCCSSTPGKGYRYLYQTRRMHGDIICQSYMESLQRLSQKQTTINETPTMTSDRTHLTILTNDSNQTEPYTGSI